MTTKRTINKVQYNVTDLVENAIAAVDGSSLDIEGARKSLQFLGHNDPDGELLTRYAREKAILNQIEKVTDANFTGQIGKIDFTNLDKAVAGVEAYLNRRNAGRRSRWNR